MKYLLKHLKYLLILLIVLIVLIYATLLPRPYYTDINLPDNVVNKTFNGPLKIITFDAGLLDLRIVGRTMYKPTEYIDQRAKLIPQQLLTRNADIIALQEVYEKKHIDFFISKLKKEYPYYFFKHNSYFKLNNGLMIFSKFPFVSTKGESQNEKGPIDELFIADRGLLSAVIKLDNNTNIDIVNLHATSGGTLNKQDSDSINIKRQKQIEKALELAIESNTEFQIIVGDINAGPSISKINYAYLLENDFTDAYGEYSKVNNLNAKPTWEGANPLNAMHGYTAADNQRIDHLYLSKQLTNNSQIILVERIFDENIFTVEGKSFPLSGHYGVELILAIN